MYTDMFKSVNEQLQSFTNPLVRYNQLVAANLEKLAKLQLASTTAYTDLGLSQLKAAANAKDPQGLAELGSKQLDTLAKVSNRMLEDIQSLNKIGVAFKEGVDSLVAESAQQATGAQQNAK